MAVPRAWLLAADRPGGVPDEKFGVSKDAGFPYFAKMVYQHSEKYPTGTMGNFSEELLPEVLLREVYKFMLDAGLRVRMEAALAAGVQQGANTMYTLNVANVGRAKIGPPVEDVTIFVRIPPGATLVAPRGRLQGRPAACTTGAVTRTGACARGIHSRDPSAPEA